MATEKRLIEYYVVQNKSTGFYFRGKGANRWGEYHNQASIYRSRAHAENTANWLERRGEPVEIVPIRIIENPTVDAAEVVHGRWIEDRWTKWQCDKCHSPSPAYGYPRMEYVKTRYCPNCGADMRERKDNDCFD